MKPVVIFPRILYNDGKKIQLSWDGLFVKLMQAFKYARIFREGWIEWLSNDNIPNSKWEAYNH